MSKVFKAERCEVEFDYEFLDGNKAVFTYRQPTQKEIEEAILHDESSKLQSETMAYRREQFKKQVSCKNSPELVEKMIDEQREHGSIYEMQDQLNNMVAEERRKKKQI